MAYVTNNPMTMTDPTGFCQEADWAEDDTTDYEQYYSCMASEGGGGGYESFYFPDVSSDGSISVGSDGYFYFQDSKGKLNNGPPLDVVSVSASPDSMSFGDWVASTPWDGISIIPGADLGTCAYNGVMHAIDDAYDACSVGQVVGAAGAVLAAIVPVGRVLRVLQTGGRTLASATIDSLNEYAGTSFSSDAFQRAIESLKGSLGIANDFPGIIKESGDYIHPDTGDVLGNIFDYVP
jgi:hypothetical protein